MLMSEVHALRVAQYHKTMDKPTFNNTPFERLLDLAEKAEASLIITELSAYDKDLMELHEQCRKGEVNEAQLSARIHHIACIHGKMTFEVIADLFAC
jgi:hypothetical protein